MGGPGDHDTRRLKTLWADFNLEAQKEWKLARFFCKDSIYVKNRSKVLLQDEEKTVSLTAKTFDEEQRSNEYLPYSFQIIFSGLVLSGNCPVKRTFLMKTKNKQILLYILTQHSKGKLQTCCFLSVTLVSKVKLAKTTLTIWVKN